jgi:hypothetical protein
MTESLTHYNIKVAVSEALKKLGYKTQVEKHFRSGIMDISAVNDKGEEIEIEIYKTHLPDRFVIGVKNGELNPATCKKLIMPPNYSTTREVPLPGSVLNQCIIRARKLGLDLLSPLERDKELVRKNIERRYLFLLIKKKKYYYSLEFFQAFCSS